MVPAGSDRVSRARPYSGTLVREGTDFRVRGLYPLWRGFPPASASTCFCNSPTVLRHDHADVLQPRIGNARRLSLRHGLGCSRFARHYSGSRGFFPFLGLLRCFSSPAYLHCAYGFSAGYRAHYHGWVSPFGNPRIKARSAAPRGLSQPSTSFIGSWCQGIHRVPFSLLIADSREHQYRYAVFKVRAGRMPAAERDSPPARGRRRRAGARAPVSQNSTACGTDARTSAATPVSRGRHRFQASPCAVAETRRTSDADARRDSGSGQPAVVSATASLERR